jgi:DNA-binding response OmpR family regulator
VTTDLAGEKMTWGGYQLDPARLAVDVRGAKIALTSTEWRVLGQLVARHGGVVTRQELFRAVWGPEAVGRPGALRVHLRRLRMKLGRAPGVCIITVYRVGYRLVPG